MMPLSRMEGSPGSENSERQQQFEVFYGSQSCIAWTQKKSQHKISCGIMRKASTFSGNSDVVKKVTGFREEVLKEVWHLGGRKELHNTQGDFKPSDATSQYRNKQE